MGEINFAIVFMKRMMAIAVGFVFLFGFVRCKKNLSPGNYQVSITAAGQPRSGVPENLGIDYQVQVDIQETAGVGGTITSTTIRLCEDYGFQAVKEVTTYISYYPGV